MFQIAFIQQPSFLQGMGFGSPKWKFWLKGEAGTALPEGSAGQFHLL